MLLLGIAEKVALGPEEGQGYRLVGVSGTQHAGSTTACNYVKRHVRAAQTVVGVEYAGRADNGDQVYLVTYTLRDSA